MPAAKLNDVLSTKALASEDLADCVRWTISAPAPGLAATPSPTTGAKKLPVLYCQPNGSTSIGADLPPPSGMFSSSRLLRFGALPISSWAEEISPFLFVQASGN
jgi:hypothetical protein